MPDQNDNFLRRDFLGNALMLGAGSQLAVTSLLVNASEKNIRPAANFQSLSVLQEFPIRVFVEQDGKLKTADRQGSRFTCGQVVVNLVSVAAGQEVRVSCPTGPLSRVALRWETTFPGDTLFLGDAWERSHGDPQWRFLQPERILPWYFAAHQEATGRTFMAGVKTQPLGVNTLAFRLPQNATFFAGDADCAAHTGRSPWEFDRQYFDLVARSGTALFISLDPRTIQPEQKRAFRAAVQTALAGGAPGGCEPLDWLHTTAPRRWRCGDEKVTFRWEEPAGVNALRV